MGDSFVFEIAFNTSTATVSKPYQKRTMSFMLVNWGFLKWDTYPVAFCLILSAFALVRKCEWDEGLRGERPTEAHQGAAVRNLKKVGRSSTRKVSHFVPRF